MSQAESDRLLLPNNSQYVKAKELEKKAETMENENKSKGEVEEQFTQATEIYRQELAATPKENSDIIAILNNELCECIAQHGHFLYRKGDYAQAEAKYMEVLTINEEHFVALHQLGMCQYEVRNYPEARKYFEMELVFTETDEDTADAYINIAYTYMKESNWSEAQYNLEQAKTYITDYPAIKAAESVIARSRTSIFADAPASQQTGSTQENGYSKQN